jgi:hypothetical protein
VETVPEKSVSEVMSYPPPGRGPPPADTEVRALADPAIITAVASPAAIILKVLNIQSPTFDFYTHNPLEISAGHLLQSLIIHFYLIAKDFSQNCGFLWAQTPIDRHNGCLSYRLFPYREPESPE